MTVSIPQDIQARINKALAELPAVQGKIYLQFEFHCGTSGYIESLEVFVGKREKFKAM